MFGLFLPETMLERLCLHAQSGFPLEVCGMLEGVREGKGWRVLEEHSAQNHATAPEREFLIDPAALAQLQREARSRGTLLIGCYHSHPNGEAAPSARDAERAGEADGPAVWLVLPVRQGVAASPAAYAWSTQTGFEPLPVIAQ